MKIAIIGAGVSGLVMSKLLANNFEVHVFERLSRPGRKLLASGNGKANISNINVCEDYYNNKEFVKKIYDMVPKEMVFKLFKEFNIFTTTDNEGRIYPYSLSSKTILDSFLYKNNAIFHYDFMVNKITCKNNLIYINDLDIAFDHLICASGSLSSVNYKNVDDVYGYLDFVKLTNLTPSLTGFKLKENVGSISGVRVKANVCLYVDGRKVYSEFGEVIFKDDGISGIVIMNISHLYNKYKKSKCMIELDLLYNNEINELNDYNLYGILNDKLVNYFNKNKLDKKSLKALRFNILSTYDFKQSQVTSGGVDLRFVNEYLELIKNPKIHFAGEILDVDGRCGGFNIHFAIACAILNVLRIRGKI